MTALNATSAALPWAAEDLPSAAARLTAGSAWAVEMRPARQRWHPQGGPWGDVHGLDRIRNLYVLCIQVRAMEYCVDKQLAACPQSIPQPGSNKCIVFCMIWETEIIILNYFRKNRNIVR